MKYLIKVLLTFMLVSVIGCGDEQPKSIMGEPVEFTINLNAWDKELRDPFVVKTFTTPRAGGPYIGLGGLLVISNGNEIIAPNIFGLFAYDLACPHEKNKNVLLSIDEKNRAVCKKCGSKFNIMDGVGNKEEGISETGLQRYSVRLKSVNPDVFNITR